MIEAAAFARRQPAEFQREEQHREQSQPEDRHTETHETHRCPQRVFPRAHMARAKNPEPHTGGGGDQQSHDGQFNRRGPRPRQVFLHIAARDNRLAKTPATERVLEPDPVLQRQGPIQGESLANRRDPFRGRIFEKQPRRAPEQEDRDAGDKQRHHQRPDPP